MAQLKDTTINGGLTVKSSGAGVELFGSTPYIDFHFNNDSGDYTSRIIESSSGVLNVQATDLKLNGDSLGKPNTLFHESQNQAVAKVVYDTDSDGTKYWYFRPDSDVAATAILGTSTTRWRNIYSVKGDFTGRVDADEGFMANNGYAFSSLDTSGTRKSLIYLSSGNNINIGNSTTGGATSHTGHTYVNSSAGNVILQNKIGAVTFANTVSTKDGYEGIFRPGTDNKIWLGSTSYRWRKIYAGTATVATSDEREKSEITSIADYPVTFSRSGSGNVFEQLHDKLNPTTYYLNGDENSGLHIGFIAQDIVKSVEELGLSEEDLAFVDHRFWEDEETGEEKDRYGLAYEEIIALNTYVIQKQKQEIELLKEEVNSLKDMIVCGS